MIPVATIALGPVVLSTLVAAVLGALGFAAGKRQSNLPDSDDWETRYKALEQKVRGRRWFR